MYFIYLLAMIFPVFVGMITFLICAKLYKKMSFQVAVIISILAAVITLGLLQSIYLVQENEAIVIERIGKFNRVLQPGLHMIIPFFEYPRELMVPGQARPYYKVDTRQQVALYKTKPARYIAQADRYTALPNPDAVHINLYYHIVNPQAATYATANLEVATSAFIQQVVEAMVQDSRSMNASEALTFFNKEKPALLEKITSKLQAWGVAVDDIQITF